MNDAAQGDRTNETSLPLPPLTGGHKPVRGRVTFPLACATAVCVALAALVLQNLWENFRPLLDEAREGTGLVPMVALCGAALVAALVVAGLLLRRIKRLLTSLRMTGAALLTLALLLTAGGLVGPQGPLALTGPAAEAKSRPRKGESRKAGGDKAAALVRVAHLEDPGSSWAVLALAGFLALGSAAGILWRRPVGGREFGFLAAHLGLLILLGGLVAGHILGQTVYARLIPGATPTAVPLRPDREPDFRLRLVRTETERRPPAVRILATRKDAEAPPRALPLDVRSRASIVWQDLGVSVVDFRESAVPEIYVEKTPGRGAVPAVKIALSGPQGSQEVVLPVGGTLNGSSAPMGLALAYEKYTEAQDAASACRREEELQPYRLTVLQPDGQPRDSVDIPAGRRCTGSQILLADVGVLLQVVRSFRAKPGSDAPLAPGEPAEDAELVLELAPTGPGAAPAAVFQVRSGGKAAEPSGKVPPELSGMKLALDTVPAQPGARLVEGPAGTFALVEIDDGAPVQSLPMSVGEEAKLARGIRFKLVESIPAALAAYRPAAGPSPRASQPAVQLEVRSTSGSSSKFWIFPGLSGPRDVGGVLFSAELLPRAPERKAAVLEVIGENGPLGEHQLVMGRPLQLQGWRLNLSELRGADRPEGSQATAALVVIRRDPGLWPAYVGMILLAIGAPWLLWTRLRRVPEMTRRGS